MGSTTVPVLDVHELLAYIHNDLRLQCPEDKVRQYWQHLRSCGMPFATNHPGSDSHVPFSLYGDECSLGDPKDKVTAMFLTLTLFKPKKVRLGQFLLFAMKDEYMVHDSLATMTPILKHIVWSANLAFKGHYPVTDAFGNSLPASKRRKAGQLLVPDGTKFACSEIRGDWKWHERILRLRHTPVSKKVCFMCDAVGDDNCPAKYYDTCDDDADGPGWVSTEKTTAQFINEKVRPGILSPLGKADSPFK